MNDQQPGIVRDRSLRAKNERIAAMARYRAKHNARLVAQAAESRPRHPSDGAKLPGSAPCCSSDLGGGVAAAAMHWRRLTFCWH